MAIKKYRVINKLNAPLELHIRRTEEISGYHVPANGVRILSQGEYDRWENRAALERLRAVVVEVLELPSPPKPSAPALNPDPTKEFGPQNEGIVPFLGSESSSEDGSDNENALSQDQGWL